MILNYLIILEETSIMINMPQNHIKLNLNYYVLQIIYHKIHHKVNKIIESNKIQRTIFFNTNLFK